MRRAVVPLLSATVFLAAAQSSLASQIAALSLADLTTQADAIVVADVLDVRSRWDTNHRRILTTVTIQVNEAWKGSIPGVGKMTIVQPGGSVGDIEMEVLGMPRFTLGERAVLFLQGQKEHRVVGLNEGKRTVEWNARDRQWWVGAAQRVHRIRGQADVGSEESLDERATLDTWRARIRTLLGD